MNIFMVDTNRINHNAVEIEPHDHSHESVQEPLPSHQVQGIQSRQQTHDIGRLFLSLGRHGQKPPSLYIYAPWLDLVSGNRTPLSHYHRFGGYVCDLWSMLIKWLRTYDQTQLLLDNCFFCLIKLEV